MQKAIDRFNEIPDRDQFTVIREMHDDESRYSQVQAIRAVGSRGATAVVLRQLTIFQGEEEGSFERTLWESIVLGARQVAQIVVAMGDEQRRVKDDERYAQEEAHSVPGPGDRGDDTGADESDADGQ